MTQACYGVNYGKENNCNICKIDKFCRTAGYPSPQKRVDLSIIENYKNITPQVKEDLSGTIKDVSTILSEFILYLKDDLDNVYKIFYVTEKFKELLDSHQITFLAAILRIKHPEWSYEKIAAELKINKGLITFYLAQAKSIFPELKEAIITDKRKFPRSERRKRKVLRVVQEEVLA